MQAELSYSYLIPGRCEVANYFGKSPDLRDFIVSSSFPVIHQWIFGSHSLLQWPVRSGFTPDSSFIFAHKQITKIIY